MHLLFCVEKMLLVTCSIHLTRVWKQLQFFKISLSSLFISPDIPDIRPRPVYITATRNNENVYSTKIPYMAARVVFIKWLVTFFLEKKYLTAVQNTKNGGEMLPKIIQVCFKVYLFFLMYMLTLQMITMQERNATPKWINGVFDYLIIFFLWWRESLRETLQ